MAYFSPNTVDVKVSLGTSPSQLKTFDVAAGIVGHNINDLLIETYLDAKTVLSAGFAQNSPTHRMAVGLFNGGIAAPASFKTVRCDISAYTLKVTGIPAVGQVVSVNANVNKVSKVASYTVVDADDATKVAEGLLADLQALFPEATTGNPVFTSATDTITATIAADTFPCSFGWNSETANLPHVEVGSVTADVLTDKLASAYTQDSNMTALMSEYKTPADIKSLAAVVKEYFIQLFTSSSDADSKNSASPTSLIQELAALEYDETEFQWTQYANSYFPEAAYLGNIMGLKPYTLYSVSGVTLNGVPKDDQLTAQERVTLTSRNANIYITERGTGVYKDGYAVSGQFVDTVRFGNWSAETVEQILFDLKKKKADLGSAIPYTDGGALMMKSAVIKDYVNVGIRGGRIATGTTEDEFGNTIDLNAKVDFGTRAMQTDADITNRIWRNGVVEVVMISGINYIETNVYIESNRQFVL
ncbi:tail sheath protein [Vibrio phage 1.084.O._10N.261.49.F5]|nr:tail sheath protein [Vibrio phage 1.084.O._10N.261.49.F5]